MKVLFKVHSVAEAETSTVATVKGIEMKVTIPCYETVLTDGEGNHGTLVLRFTGPDYETAKKLFQNKKEITVTLS